MKRIVYIYGLFDPRTSRVRYVGKSVDPVTRLRMHISHRSTPKYSNFVRRQWFDELQALGMKPGLVWLAETTEESWQEEERKWIALFRQFVPDLLNVLAGGNGAMSTVDLARRQRIAQSLRGRKRPSSIGARMTAFQTGRKQSQETCERRRQSMLTRFENPAARAKRTKELRARWNTDERMRQFRQWFETPREQRTPQSEYAYRKGHMISKPTIQAWKKEIANGTV